MDNISISEVTDGFQGLLWLILYDLAVADRAQASVTRWYGEETTVLS